MRLKARNLSASVLGAAEFRGREAGRAYQDLVGEQEIWQQGAASFWIPGFFFLSPAKPDTPVLNPRPEPSTANS